MLILNCRLRDDLVDRARAGDPDALRLLFAALPADMPANVRTAARDAAIRRLADGLRAVVSDASNRRIAKMLADAGAQIDADHPGLVGFDWLEESERKWIEIELRSAMSWLPRRRSDGRRWPRRRQIESIIAS